MSPDGFVIDADAGRLVLAGNPPHGTSFAVYAFLERFAGVRWLWPGDLGTIVPRIDTLRVPPVSLREEPAYAWRDLGPGGALWGPLDRWTKERELGVSEEHQRLQRQWEKRNRFGGLRIHGGHAFGKILPPAKYGREHPEYFALVKGKRDCDAEGFNGKHGRQPCTTHPDVIRLAVDYCDRQFRDHPDYDAVAISLNDGGGFCECERCRALDDGGEAAGRADPETGAGGAHRVITDRVLTFANAVTAEVVKLHPGKKLILFAYHVYRKPMRVRPHPDLIIQYTLHACTHWLSSAETHELSETEAWGRTAKHAAVYEYYIQGGWPDMPRLFTPLVQRSVQRLHGQGYRMFQTQAGDGYAVNGLTWYALGKLLWNPALDLEALKRDYVGKGFGKGAPAVARFLDRWEAAWRERGGHTMMDGADPDTYRKLVALYPASLREACRKDLEEAAGLAEGADRERVEFLRRGFRYVEMTLDAVEKGLALMESGWDLSGAVTAPEGADRGAFERALAAWEERDRYVESLRDDFVLAYFCIRYNDHNRTFNPLRRMTAAKTGGDARPSR
jgi:hypothetical protein